MVLVQVVEQRTAAGRSCTERQRVRPRRESVNGPGGGEAGMVESRKVGSREGSPARTRSGRARRERLGSLPVQLGRRSLEGSQVRQGSIEGLEDRGGEMLDLVRWHLVQLNDKKEGISIRRV
jgi:hypothetical protein